MAEKVYMMQQRLGVLKSMSDTYVGLVWTFHDKQACLLRWLVLPEEWSIALWCMLHTCLTMCLYGIGCGYCSAYTVCLGCIGD